MQNDAFTSCDRPEPPEITIPHSRPEGEISKITSSERGRNLSSSEMVTKEHDDPVLKALIEMGFARSEALEALEKHDYHLDKVCCSIPFTRKGSVAYSIL